MQEKCSKSSKVKCRTPTQRDKKVGEKFRGWGGKVEAVVVKLQYTELELRAKGRTAFFYSFFVDCVFKKQQCPTHQLLSGVCAQHHLCR